MRSRFTRHLDWLLAPQASRAKDRRALFFTAKVAPAQLPPGFSGHDLAVFLLHVAAEIEHVLMVQYLYAAYSLGGDQVPHNRREEVSRWQEVILGIAKEEMGHLITVQNMLRLLGGPLNLERNDYPWDAPFYPFEFTLERLSRGSLARYVFTESPEKWPSDVSADEKKEIIRLAAAGQTKPVNQVGKLYGRLIDVIGDADLVPDELFQADTLPYQASWDEWGRGYRQGARGNTLSPGNKSPDVLIRTAYSRTTAVDALTAIAHQGEAPDMDPDTDDKSHFRRFLEIFRRFPTEKDRWSPTVPVATNPRVLGGDEDIPKTVWISDPHSRAWAELLNLRYRMLLAYLSHAFNLSGAHGHVPGVNARGMLVHHTFGEMYNLRSISRLLVQMPAGASKETRAGPPFDMPYTVKLPAAERDCWRLHLDLLEASANLIRDIEAFADEHAKDYLTTLAGLDRETIVAVERLLSMRDRQVAARNLERSAV